MASTQLIMPRTAGFLDFFPETPGYLLADVDVKYERKDNQSPPTFHPDKEHQVEQGNYAEFDPLGTCCFSHNALDHFKNGNKSLMPKKPCLSAVYSCCQHSSQSKAAAGLGVMGNGDAVCL